MSRSRSTSITKILSPAPPEPLIVFAISDQFPEANDRMKTSQFLDGATAAVSLAERFGKVFFSVTFDMNINIQKLRLKYEENKRDNEILKNMILREQNEGGVNTTDALMWLRRELHFLSNVFQYVIDDRSDREPMQFLNQAYAETLEQYHGWLGSQLLNVLSRFAPTRSSFLSILEHNRNGKVITDLRSYNERLTACVRWLTELYSMHGLETFATVIFI